MAAVPAVQWQSVFFFEKRHGRSSILALNIFPVDVSKSAMNKFIPYLQFGKINCLLCHVSKYGEYEMLHQSEDPKRKEINMIFENSVIRISNFFESIQFFQRRICSKNKKHCTNFIKMYIRTIWIADVFSDTAGWKFVCASIFLLHKKSYLQSWCFLFLWFSLSSFIYNFLFF